MTAIAVIPGDGVGPEVVEQAQRVLRAITDLDSRLEFEFDSFPWGTNFYLEHRKMMPEDGLEALSRFDAILFGAVGSPLVKDYITLRQLLFRIRSNFDQFVNLRPIHLLPGLETPLRNISPVDVDMIFVRENTEGEYIGMGDRLYAGSEREVALQIAAFSRHGTERVIRWAFDLARKTQQSVTSISKGNALQYSGALWDETFQRVASEYPDIESHELLVDAAAMFMVSSPQRFEVVVASNLYADILTDLGAALIGGIGLAPSANLNPERRFPSMFEPIHGSAPDIAGKGIANPVGAIWSAAMMLDHLGHSDWGDQVRQAIAVSVRDPATRTRDLGGTASTSAAGDAIVKVLLEGHSELTGEHS